MNKKDSDLNKKYLRMSTNRLMDSANNLEYNLSLIEGILEGRFEKQRKKFLSEEFNKEQAIKVGNNLYK